MRCAAFKAFALAAAATALAAASADAAAPAGDLSDLVGVYAIPGQNKLKARGWVRVRASESGVVRATFWSRDKDRACVKVSVANSRIVAVDPVDYDSSCAKAAKPSPR